MTITRVLNAGMGGVNKDISPTELPVGDVDNFTWSNSHNMRFLDGYAMQFYGHGIVYESPTVTPYFLLPLVISGDPYWIYAGESAIYCAAKTDTLGAEEVTNGAFDADTDWGMHSGWTIGSGVATSLGFPSSSLGQAISFVEGTAYRVRFDVTYTSGVFYCYVNGTYGAYRSAAGAFDEIVVAGAAGGFYVISEAFVGTVDNISVKEVISIAHTDLSGTTYTATPNSWTGGILGGIPILNNGTDYPQQWNTDTDDNFEDLSNWPIDTTCKVMRIYKQFLVAMDITIPQPTFPFTLPFTLLDESRNYPYMVKWSHPADPGAVPMSWDHTDETVDAGQTNLSEGSGHIIEGLQLRDAFIIYREGSIWIMQYTGGPYIFSFNKMLGTSGIMNRNCVVEFDGYHFVLTDNDMLVHDGNTALPVLDKQVRRDVFLNIDADARNVAFVLKNPFFNEIWVCYPSVGATSCDKAVVWNYRDKTVAFKELPDVYHGAYGQIDEAVTDPWSDDLYSWSSDATKWNEAAKVPGNIRSLMASADDELYMVDAGGEGTPTSSYLERTGLTFGAAEQRTLIKGIRPRITGSTGATIKISIGGSDDDAYATPTYDSVVDYVIGTDLRADMLVDRRYLAIKFENDASAYDWQLDSFDIEWEDGGLW